MKNRNPLPSQERLRHLFDYNPETGDLIWKNPTHARIKSGDVVGRNKSWNGYRRVSIDNRLYHTHRVIWKWFYGTEPGRIIDHIDQDRTNNRIENLRQATLSQNQGNQSRLGVYKSKSKSNPWHSRVKKDGVVVWSQVFKCPLIARIAYEENHAKHHGKFSPYYTQ